jgi:UDP-glucose 4-epimerase
VQESIQNPLRSFDNNVVKTHKLLEFLRINSPNTKLVFASTGGAIIGEYEGAINEQIAANPLSPYGANKLAVEGLLSAYNGSYGLNSASMRFSNVYGPGSQRKSSVISTFCKMYIQDGSLQINGDGLQTRDYIYVDDISDAITRVIQQDGQGIFQLGTGIGTTILEIIDIFVSYDPMRKIELKYVEGLSGEVRHNKADISRITNELGFKPVFSLERGIRETLDWFQNKKL